MARIGISTSVTQEDPLAHPDLIPYAHAVRHYGGEPIALVNDRTLLDEQLARVDGLVLSGGRDVDPALFGEDRDPATRVAATERDAFEIALLHEARRRLIPVLCICRGLQIANVAFGGSLIQDLPAHFGEEYVIHHAQTYEDGRDRTDYGLDHHVFVEPGSALADLVQSVDFATNTMHHQAAKAIGRGLRAVAWTHDGVVEALDADFEHPFFYCVQWHPEELLADPVSEKLFGGLIASAHSERSLSS